MSRPKPTIISLQIRDCVDISTNSEQYELEEGSAVEDVGSARAKTTNLGGTAQWNKKEVARRRWGLLARALKSPISSQPASPTDEISLRRFSTFSLLTAEPILSTIESNCWYKYSASINSKNYIIEINHLTRNFTAADLMGFNNTGNVCVWPSEESLAYYILKNLHFFADKTILELGAGMSALAGLFVAKYGCPKKVLLTDGNDIAVENISKSLSKNNFNTEVSSCVLKWGKTKLFDVYDVILSADCLFFDEARNDLVDTIYDFLSSDGVAFVMAPRRGGTMDIFSTAAKIKGFNCEKLIFYDQAIWERHLEFLNNVEYDQDIHYPILLKLTKFRQ